MLIKRTYYPPHTDKHHIWTPTSSPLIERCSRGSCKAMRHWKDGVWVLAQRTRKPEPPATEAQPDLWASTRQASPKGVQP